MPQKTKVMIEAKIIAVENCISGKESVNNCAKNLQVHEETLRCWIRLYESRGVEGLIPATKTRKYSIEIKKTAVEDYLSGKGSLNDICVKYDISRHGMLQRWIKWYNCHGDFKQPNSGGEIYMAKGRNTTIYERIEMCSHCIANNKDYGKTIEKYGVSYQQIYTWVRKYEKDGVNGFTDNRGKHKNESSMTEIEKLQAQLKLKEAENLRLQMENELLKKLEELERRRGEG